MEKSSSDRHNVLSCDRDREQSRARRPKSGHDSEQHGGLSDFLYRARRFGMEPITHDEWTRKNMTMIDTPPYLLCLAPTIHNSNDHVKRLIDMMITNGKH
jgi:hypothetical protein